MAVTDADDDVATAFARFVAREREAGRAADPDRPREGHPAEPVVVRPDDATGLAVAAAYRAAGFFRPTKRKEIAWVQGDSQLGIGIAALRLKLLDGAVLVTIPVRCDQTGRAEVHVTLAVGAPDRPAGLYAATQRRPRGPAIVVDTWGDGLVAFAWQVVLGLATGLAGAVGKDARGNLLVPAALEATPEGLTLTPMARHRFSGSTGLKGRTG